MSARIFVLPGFRLHFLFFWPDLEIESGDPSWLTAFNSTTSVKHRIASSVASENSSMSKGWSVRKEERIYDEDVAVKRIYASYLDWMVVGVMAPTTIHEKLSVRSVESSKLSSPPALLFFVHASRTEVILTKSNSINGLHPVGAVRRQFSLGIALLYIHFRWYSRCFLETPCLSRRSS